jgi:hypothetical protein
MKTQINEIKRMQQLAGVINEAIHYDVLGNIESLIDPNTVDTAMDALGVIFNKLEQEGIDPKDIKTYIDMQINQAFGPQLGIVSR